MAMMVLGDAEEIKSAAFMIARSLGSALSVVFSLSQDPCKCRGDL